MAHVLGTVTMNFFTPPETIIACVHFDFPQSLRVTDRPSAHASQAPGDINGIFLEGPVVDRNGDLYVVDVHFGRILKVERNAESAKCCVEWDGEPNGLALMHDGRIVVADYKNGMMMFDPSDNSVTPHLLRRNLERFKGPNDLIVDSKGNIFFTDQGQTGMTDPTGKVYRLAPDGRLDCLVENGPSPNGLVLSRDEKFLYVAMTRANQVWRLPLREDGGVSKAGTFYQGFGNVGPDGLALDCEGNLFICDPGLGRVFVVDSRGMPLKMIQAEDRDAFITNCTFGGPENKTLFMTSSFSGQILKVEWHCAGATSLN